MKITVEHYGQKTSIETDYEDVNVDEAIDFMIRILVGLGYHSQCVEEAIIGKAEEYIDMEENTDDHIIN